jgi:hypothetical protein
MFGEKVVSRFVELEVEVAQKVKIRIPSNFGA